MQPQTGEMHPIAIFSFYLLSLSHTHAHTQIEHCCAESTKNWICLDNSWKAKERKSKWQPFVPMVWWVYAYPVLQPTTVEQTVLDFIEMNPCEVWLLVARQEMFLLSWEFSYCCFWFLPSFNLFVYLHAWQHARWHNTPIPPHFVFIHFHLVFQLLFRLSVQ